MKLVERIPTVCKAVIKANGGYLMKLKYKKIFGFVKHSLGSTWFHMCYFIVLMSSLLFYNVENSKIKKNP